MKIFEKEKNTSIENGWQIVFIFAYRISTHVTTVTDWSKKN